MSESGIFFDQKEKSFLNGELTRALIRRKGLRQYQVADRLRVHTATLTHLLNRQYKADPVLIVALAHLLGVEPAVLVTEPGPLPFEVQEPRRAR